MTPEFSSVVFYIGLPARPLVQSRSEFEVDIFIAGVYFN
jgi:hypothetical protein